MIEQTFKCRGKAEYDKLSGKDSDDSIISYA
jgi:hypothetical protein